ncbi:acetamidase [Trichoderma asperellum]|uniref:amidase n=1 Tax=Trichoderma asperellum TaxID=101201 RepID=A0A6V8QI60_TRIAP|nr:acetamidase [Trichoderma asperellum]
MQVSNACMDKNEADWTVKAAVKRNSVLKKIPIDWLLTSDIIQTVSEASTQNVLDLPRTCGILTQKEIDITEKYDATDLIEKLASAELTSEEVTVAFCKRAAIAQQLTHCLTEIFFEEAIAQAKEYDAYLASHGRPNKAFHGLPISVKESFSIKGVDTTLGFVSWISNPPKSDNAALVEILLREGAVLYCKTNIPTTMMTADSENNIFLRTLNPYNLCLTAGGSSGGEGSLVAQRGSILGIGTDIAGSVRIPAAMNVLNNNPWELDESAIAAPYRDLPVKSSPLRLGVITEDKERPLHPTIMRALMTAQMKLEEAGHSLVSLDSLLPETLYSVTRLAWRYFGLDASKTAMKHIQASGEPVIKSISTTSFLDMKDQVLTLNDVFEINVQRRNLQAAYRKIMVENGLDAILMPSYQSPAPKHDTYGFPMYTVLANVLDWPAGVIPYMKGDFSLDKEFMRDVPYEPSYVPENVKDVPGSLQLMGKPFCDEELIEIMAVVDKILA